MRAICGAIITAGALIGLGLTAVGYGLRYQQFNQSTINPDTHALYGAPSLAIVLIVLLVAVFVGLGIAFMGLAFHHERRERERMHHVGADSSTRVRT